MIELTDWVPNAHALVVHLPIGLLVTAAAADAAGLLRRRPEPVAAVSTALYLAGSLALAARLPHGTAPPPRRSTRRASPCRSSPGTGTGRSGA